MEDVDDVHAKILWNYLRLTQELTPADIVLCFGSPDVRVADRAADLLLTGYAPRILFSGGYGRGTSGVFEKPEAHLFAERAIARGVRPEMVLVEDSSTNTGENIVLSRAFLEEKGLTPKTAIVVHLPFMERRVYATVRKQWPELTVTVSSPQISYEEFPNETIPRELLIAVLVGNLQRIIEYPKLGFQAPEEVPEEVMGAFRALIEAGYTSELMKAPSAG